MLRSSLRTKCLAVSLLVHGSALSATLVFVAAAWPEGAPARPLAFAMAAREDTLETFDDPDTVPAEAIPAPRFDDELPPALEFEGEDPVDVQDFFDDASTRTAVRSALLPELLDERAPFAGLAAHFVVQRPPQMEPERPPPTPSVASAPELPAAHGEPTLEESDAAAPQPPDTAGLGVSAPTPLADAMPSPDYPESWARRGWVGEVTVELDVDADGAVIAARVVASSGFTRLDELARTTLETWRFAPAREGELAVAGTYRQRVEFRRR